MMSFGPKHWRVTLVVLALTSAASVPVLAAGEITGAGSSWVYPLVAKWSAAYATQTGTKVNYQPIGSGGGIAQIQAGTVAFGASDKPLTSDALRQHQLIQFPTAVAGADIVYNLPGIGPGQLILSGPVIADIYMGKVKKWNDAAIKQLNPRLALPDMSISVIHRSDGSGTTFTFANYLSKVSPEWKAKVGADTSIAWPTGFGGKGSDGVAAYVQRIRGAIGYVEYAYILQNKMSYARLINSAGRVVSPSLQGFEAAAANVDFTKAQDFYVILTNQPGEESWPISGCTWQILRTAAPKDVNQAVTTFFLWGFEHGQEMARAIAFGPLPSSTIQAIQAYWKQNLGI
jgi:phosphate transport system substrate-binding protein